MQLRSWRTTCYLVTAVVTTVLLLGAYLALRAQWGEERGVSVVEEAVVFAVAACGLAGAVYQIARRQHLRVVAQLAAQAAQLRKNPAVHTLAARAPDLADRAELAPVLAELNLLADCYRKALAEVVLAKEEVDKFFGSSQHFPPNQAAAARHLATSSRQRMVARLAPNLHWTAATPPLLQFLGCALRDVLARPFLECVHPDDAAGVERSLTEALRDGEAHNATFRVAVPYRTDLTAAAGAAAANKDDAPAVAVKEHHLQMDVMTTYDEKGAAMHLRCHFLDATDRVRTDRELRRRTEELSEANARLRQSNLDLQRLKESYRDLYHQAPVLYFGLDPAGKFVALNEAVLRTLGYTREHLLGQAYTLLLPPASRDAYQRDPGVFQRACELETQWVKADGSVIDVWIVTTPIKDAAGVFVRSRSAAHDVTERKRLATALGAKADELAQANDRLRRINQELEEFTYVVSHDLKEPLRTLQAFSTFLAQDYEAVLGGEGRDYLRHLIEASRRLGDLIDDLLSLSRAGRVIHTPRPFAWGEAIRVTLGDLGDLIQRRKAVVRVEGELPAVAGDPERVIQLLGNLVGNALKYNQSGRPEVVIGAVEDQEPFATLFVRDNGIGIAGEYHEQIFRMFRRLHRREEFEGTGAGLTICKKIVEAHGGRIWVESEPGRGSTFFFTLPRAAGGRPGAGIQAIRRTPQPLRSTLVAAAEELRAAAAEP
jgi:PAS domain S-box-containing protein